MYDILFMGAGQKSQAECFELVSDLMKAMEELSTYQQCSGYKSWDLSKEEKLINEKRVEEMIDNIDTIAIKIFMRLTGTKRSNFKKLLEIANDKIE